jgi:acyl-CoA thioesterase
MSENKTLTIDELLALAESGKKISIPESWTQGRTVYGGLSAAMLFSALEKKVDPQKSLRVLNVAFSAPTMPNETFEISTELLREGRTIAQWQASLVQSGTVCVQIQAVFGLSLESDVNIDIFEAPELPGLEEGTKFPTKDHPGFTQYFEMAQSQGDLPVSGGDSLYLGGWMKYRQSLIEFTRAHLIALIDVWPPATLMHLKELKAGSTVNWTMQFPQELAQVKQGEYVGYQNHIEYSEGGFAITHAKVWNAQGELLALSQQTVIVYA